MSFVRALYLERPLKSSKLKFEMPNQNLYRSFFVTLLTVQRVSCGIVGFWSQLNYESQVINRNRQRKKTSKKALQNIFKSSKDKSM